MATRTRVAKAKKRYPDPIAANLYRSFAGVMLPIAVFVQHTVSVYWYLAGAMVSVMGMGLILWSQATLGRYWVGGIGTHSGHRLVTRGPYSRVRHPLYSGFGLMGVGVAVLSLNPLVALTGLLIWLAVAVRAPAEEQLLAHKFKRQWTAYHARTGYFLPKLRHERSNRPQQEPSAL
jgi:protein-S-isoprenylcysteine O-methyltransferase Ste14